MSGGKTLTERIAIIGYNLFAPGGTTRSNLNLIHDFSKAGSQVTYYNYLPFSTKQVQAAQTATPALANVTLQPFATLRKPLPADVVFITRESFLPLAAWLRAQQPQLIVIGEIHTPLPMLDLDSLAPYLSDCNGVRVATSSIRRQLKHYYDGANIYIQAVSLSHLSREIVAPSGPVEDSSGNVNLSVVARFDEQKDIPYAISLVHQLKVDGHQNFRLFIEGYGPDRRDYEAQIQAAHLQDCVFIGQPAPSQHVYLSTAKLESLGYSIAEAFASGYPVALYGGDDGVIQENFAEFEGCVWLTKNLEEDAERLVAFTAKPIRSDQQQHNAQLLAGMRDDYVKRFSSNLAAIRNLPVADITRKPQWRALGRIIEQLTYGHPLDLAHRFVYAMRRLKK